MELSKNECKGYTCSNVPFEPVIHADSPDPCPGSADCGERLEIVEENGQLAVWR